MAQERRDAAAECLQLFKKVEDMISIMSQSRIEGHRLEALNYYIPDLHFVWTALVSTANNAGLPVDADAWIQATRCDRCGGHSPNFALCNWCAQRQ